MNDNGDFNGIDITVPLKYLSNFWRSLEMPLINCKIGLSLTLIENCVLATSVSIDNNAIANAAKATLKITEAERYVLVVTLSTEDNEKLSKLLSEGFKRPVNWNKYKVITNKAYDAADANAGPNIRELLYACYEGVKRLFVLDFNNAAGDNLVSVNSFKKYFSPRVKLEI